MRVAPLGLLVVLAPSAVYAQEPTPLRWQEHASVPARISDGLVAGQLGFAVMDAWRDERRGRAFACLAAENGAAILATELLKRAVRRQRPDASDRLSFPSGHTAMAVVNGAPGWRYSLSVGVGWGRQAAGKHYATDVLAGAGIGFAASRICR